MSTTEPLKAVVLAFNQYTTNKSEANLKQLAKQLDLLISVTSRASGRKHFEPRELALLPTQCVTCLVEILNDPAVPTELASKAILTLSNLASNVDIQAELCSTYHLTDTLVAYLHAYAGPQTDSAVSQCLYLLQKLTYNCPVSQPNSFTDHLLRFLMTHVHESVDSLSLPCLGLLANLCRHSLAIQAHLKARENIKAFYRTLIKNLSHNNKTVTIYSLSIFTSLCLQEDLGQKLFNARNIRNTFQLIFNILVHGDSQSAVSTNYAVDLLIDLQKHPRIQQSLVSYEHIAVCIKQVVELLVNREEVTKILELLVCFCGIAGLRPMLCQAVMASPSLQAGGRGAGEPLVVVARQASLGLDDTHPDPRAPLLALDLLREIYEEMVDCSLLVQLSPCLDLVLPTLTQILVPPAPVPAPSSQGFQPSIHHHQTALHHHFQKTTKAVQILLVLCGEPSLREEVVGWVDVKACLDMVDYQFHHNHLALGLTKASTPPQPLWSQSGEGALLFVLDLLHSLHRDIAKLDLQLNKLLQDERLLPFLAFALTSDLREQVQIALRLITSASLLPGFQTILLGDTVAACNTSRLAQLQSLRKPVHIQAGPPASTPTGQGQHPPLGGGEVSSGLREGVGGGQGQGGDSLDHNLDQLIQRMQSGGMDLKDFRASEIMSIYEQKLASFATKESHLQDLLEAKALALSQADRLIAQYRSRRAQSEAEAHNLRGLLHKSEKHCEEYLEEVNQVRLQKERLAAELDRLTEQTGRLQEVAAQHQQLKTTFGQQTQQLEAVQQSLAAEKEERQQLQDIHDTLVRHARSLETEHDQVKGQLSEAEEERRGLSERVREQEDRLKEVGQRLSRQEGAAQRLAKEKEELEGALDQLRHNLYQSEDTRKQLQQQLSSLEAECSQQKATIQENQQSISQLQDNLNKHTEIARMINSLTSTNLPSQTPPQK